MLPGLELAACTDLAMPMDVMQHVVRVESSFNPLAIGVVGGRLVRQPKTLDEALSTVRMLEERGYNFSLGIAQVNRYNLQHYGLDSYEQAFQACPNLKAGSKILAECYGRAGGDWGRSFSCYYSGNFTTGFRHGYVQKVYASISRAIKAADGPQVAAIDVVEGPSRRQAAVTRYPAQSRRDMVAPRITEAPMQRRSAPQEAPMVASGMPAAALAGPALPASTSASTAGRGPALTTEDIAVPTVSMMGGPGSQASAAASTQAAPSAAAPPLDDGRDNAFVF